MNIIMQEYKFCPICRSPLEVDFIEGRDRLNCHECKWVNYRNPLPVVACLVLSGRGELLLIRRGVEPCKGAWALPGGFIELDENYKEAGRRELNEETGLVGEPGRLIGVHMHKSPMYGALVVIGIEFIVNDEALTVGDDAEDAKFFTTQEMPEIPFLSHRNLIEDFLK